MTDRSWFEGIDIDDVQAGADRIRRGDATEPRPWPALAIEAGAVESLDDYHERLRAAALAAFEDELDTLAGTADRELVQLVRTLDAVTRVELELRQRIAEALTEGTTRSVGPDELQDAVVAAGRDDGVVPAALAGLVETTQTLRAERDQLETAVTRQALAVIPNLAELAGPLLAARLVADAGSLESLAKMPSSTVQVLGAEGALFAHLRGEAPSPKHGRIFTHPAVRSATGNDRGTVARVLAGKLSIAARIDHYRGELEPSLADDLHDRLDAVIGGEG